MLGRAIESGAGALRKLEHGPFGWLRCQSGGERWHWVKVRRPERIKIPDETALFQSDDAFGFNPKPSKLVSASFDLKML